MAKKRYYFHASSPTNRNAIQRRGLRAGTKASYGPPAVYLFKDRMFAENYISDELLDVWRVDTENLTLWPDPEDPTAAVYSEHTISPSRLKWLGTYQDGKQIYV